ncbi:MAG: elongation factor G, partial [Oscillospiraceae bacterium]
MKQYLADKIRNIALAGHGGCGKTSLAEAMLFMAGATDRLGKVENGNTVCDFDPEEIKRGVSVSSSVASFEWNNTKFNVLDTPGLFDFATGLYEGIRAAGSVVVVLSAKDGMQVGTEKAYNIAKEQNKSVMFFVNNSDAENADFYKVLGELRAKLGKQVCPLMIPYLEDKKVICYIDLLKYKAYKYSKDGKSVEMPIPENAVAIVDEYRNTINEAVAETDEALMDKFFGGEAFTEEELINGINEGFRVGNFFPVSCGSSITLEGIDMFLNCMVNHMPSAKNAGSENGVTADGEDVRINCDILEPLAAYVFKTIADPFVGKLSFIKVIGGQLTPDMNPVNSRTGETEKIGKIVSVCGKRQEDVVSVPAGDIAAVTKLSETGTGDTLCDPRRVVSLRRVGYPMATLTMALISKNKGDEGKVAQGIQKIKEEDPLLKFVQDPETHQQLISGLGEQHLDVVISKLKNKFGIEVSLEKPKIAYRETIRKKVKVQGRHKKQSGGHGQFGDVWIEFEPCDSEGMVFETNVVGGSVPKNYFPAVEKGLQDSIKK